MERLKYRWAGLLAAAILLLGVPFFATERKSASAAEDPLPYVECAPDDFLVWYGNYDGSFYTSIDGAAYRKMVKIDSPTGISLLPENCTVEENDEIELSVHIPSGAPKLSISVTVDGTETHVAGSAVFTGHDGTEKTLTVSGGKVQISTTAITATENLSYKSAVGTLTVQMPAGGALEKINVYGASNADNVVRFTVGEVKKGGDVVWASDGLFESYNPDNVPSTDFTVEHVVAGTTYYTQFATDSGYQNLAHHYLSIPAQLQKTKTVDGQNYAYVDLGEVKGFSLYIENEGTTSINGIFTYIYDAVTGKQPTFATGKSTLSTSPAVRVGNDGVIESPANPTVIPAGFKGTIYIPLTEEVFINQAGAFPTEIKPIIHFAVNNRNTESFIAKNLRFYTDDTSWQICDIETFAVGGDIETHSGSVFHGSSAVFEFTPYKGYYFESAYYKFGENGEQVNITPDENGRYTVENITDDLLVSATFTEAEYTITYHLDGGENSTANPSVYFVYTMTVVLEEPTKEGYTFAGWYDNANFEGEAVTHIAKGSTGNIELYAKWEKAGGCASEADGGSWVLVAAALTGAGAAVLITKRHKKHEEK